MFVIYKPDKNTKITSINTALDKKLAMSISSQTNDRNTQQLSVNRRTLVNWSRKFSDRLENESAIEKEVTDQAAKDAERARIQQMADLHDRILAELSQRPLKEIPTDRLALLAWRLQRKSTPLPDKLTFTEAFTEDHILNADIPDPKITWKA